MTKQDDESQTPPTSLRTFAQFLENPIPGQSEKVSDATKLETIPPARSALTHIRNVVIAWPRIQLYCPECGGQRYFGPFYAADKKLEKVQDLFVHYHCKNCNATFKKFALSIAAESVDRIQDVTVTCYGSYPQLDEKIPNKLLALVSSDRALFLQGRKAEKSGLGIGAFSYYRRVVENQKNEILGAVAEAARTLGDDALADEIIKASQEPLFTSAIESIKHALPETLRVGGHDPLRVLYRALSEGLHNKDDQHCLEYAETVREVLGGLADRIAQTKKDEKKLRESISKLMKDAI
jgi:transposase-like protein